MEFPSEVWFHLLSVLGLALVAGVWLVLTDKSNHSNAKTRDTLLAGVAVLGIDVFCLMLAVETLSASAEQLREHWDKVILTVIKLCALVVGNFCFINMGSAKHKSFAEKLQETQRNVTVAALTSKKSVEAADSNTNDENVEANLQSKKERTTMRQWFRSKFLEEKGFVYPTLVLVSALLTLALSIWLFAALRLHASDAVASINRSA